jgi:hypothetical protein
MDKSLMLNPADYVGVSFWIISAAMVAATYFFYVERDRAVGKWKTSLTVAAMVTGIAAIHYFICEKFGLELENRQSFSAMWIGY